MIGTTSTVSILHPYRSIQCLMINGGAQTASFDAIVDHYYVVGGNVLHGTSEVSNPRFTNCTVIKAGPVQRSTASSSLTSDEYLCVIKATAPTVTVNIRHGTNMSTQFECIHYLDLGPILPTLGNITSVAANETIATTKGNYYIAMVSVLHNYSQEEYACIARGWNCQIIKRGTVLQSYVSNPLCSHGFLCVFKAGFTSARLSCRNITSNTVAYSCISILDMGTNYFIF